MIKANELRIGNIVRNPHTKEDKPVTLENISDIQNGFLSREGTPITEDWLIKFGFNYRNESRGLGAILDFKPYTDLEKVYSWKFSQSVALIHDKDNIEDKYYTVLAHPTAYKLKYVHQLQNLYFALTNEELTIKL